VKQNATLNDLKDSIKLHFRLKHDQGPKSYPCSSLNWNYVWRNFYLKHENEKLTDNKKQLRNYGIGNRSTLQFEKIFHSKRKKQ
jgi:U11/U12 small nuclear ribonucleoprotein SNRNP25